MIVPCLVGGATGLLLRTAPMRAPMAASGRSGLFSVVLQQQEGVPIEGANIAEEMQEILMDQMVNGVEAGGWDNDEYLEASKTRPVTSDYDLLRQGLAYVRMMKDKRQRLTPQVEDFRSVSDM